MPVRTENFATREDCVTTYAWFVTNSSQHRGYFNVTPSNLIIKASRGGASVERIEL